MFDPFDERHRDKRTRRKRSEIEFQKEEWMLRLERILRGVLEDQNWPNYVNVHILLDDLSYQNCPHSYIKRNLEALMKRVGYVKFRNDKSADGRFKIFGMNTTVYRRENSQKIGFLELKQYFGMK